MTAQELATVMVRGNPLTVVEFRRYARVLRPLLASLDREVVESTLIDDGGSDLLGRLDADDIGTRLAIYDIVRALDQLGLRNPECVHDGRDVPDIEDHPSAGLDVAAIESVRHVLRRLSNQAPERARGKGLPTHFCLDLGYESVRETLSEVGFGHAIHDDTVHEIYIICMIELAVYEDPCTDNRMDLHTFSSGKMTAAQCFVDEVRAEMARQRRPNTELALALRTNPQTIGRRLSGDNPFNAVEMVLAAQFLGISLTILWERAAAAQPGVVAS